MNNAIDRSAVRITAGLRSCYEYIALYVSLVIFGIVGLAYTLVAAVLYPLLPRRFGARLGRRIMTGLFRTYVALIESTGLLKCDLSALDALASDEAVIIAPNHPGLIDVVLVGSRLKNIVCIMKADIQDNIILGGGARLAGYIRNDPIGNMVRTSVTELKQGCQLLVFPEGTRTTGQPVNQFKSAFALIASRAGVPVQTVFIEYSSAFLGKGWPLWKKPQFPLAIQVKLGERFEVCGDTRSFVAGLEKYFRDQLAVK